MRRKHFIWKTAKEPMCCFTTAHVSPEYSRTNMTMHRQNCILTDRVKALEDQTLARLSCWKALFAAVGIATYHASSVQIQTPDSAP